MHMCQHNYSVVLFQFQDLQLDLSFSHLTCAKLIITVATTIIDQSVQMTIHQLKTSGCHTDMYLAYYSFYIENISKSNVIQTYDNIILVTKGICITASTCKISMHMLLLWFHSNYMQIILLFMNQ